VLIQSYPTFPSLLVTRIELKAKGEFAETQAMYLDADQKGTEVSIAFSHHPFAEIEELASFLRDKKVGVVARFYMNARVSRAPDL